MSQAIHVPPEIREMGPMGIALWTCMLAGPHTKANCPGLWEVRPATIFELLGGKRLAPEQLREAENVFEGILVARLAIFDEHSGLLRIPGIWDKHYAPTMFQVFGWKNAWVRYENTPFKFYHLPTLRRIAELSPDALQAFDVRFGLIEFLNTRTYKFGDGWKKGQPIPQGIRLWQEPPDRDLRYKKIDHLFFSREISREDLRLDLDLCFVSRDSPLVQCDSPLVQSIAVASPSTDSTATNEQMEVANGQKPTINGAATQSDTSRDSVEAAMRLSRGSNATQSDTSTNGNGKESRPPSVTASVGVPDDERRTGERARNGGASPRTSNGGAPHSPSAPGASGSVPARDSGGGGGGQVVPIKVPPGQGRRPKYNHD